MSSVVSSQFGTYTSSRDSSTISGNTEREDFTPTQENLENLIQRTEVMKRENALFIEYARRNNKELFPPGQPIENTTRRARIRKRGKILQFPTNRKLEMATQVIEKIENDIKLEEHRGSNQIAEIRARQVQVLVREKEIEKEMLQFTKEVIEEGRDERSGHIIGEKLLKWYDDTIKSKESKISKLHLKRDSMKSQIARTRARLQQKLELGEKLQQVDYDQLKIDRDAYQVEITKLSQKLASLQKTSSSVVSRLNDARSTLANEEKRCKMMAQSIEQKQKAIGKYAKEAEIVEEDHEKLKMSNIEIATKKSEYRVPDVSDYIDKKAKIYELSKVIKNWERKVQLAEMNVKRLRKELKALDSPRK
ncbi:coiled-coil domain-containing protein [Histomonas meleagridis]|uniref:coiled-coil domain-containing protein n=1 Tax=Histomonas meleagridis TaxID=135588 RepID=UPI0035596BB5|nr:coiled-coil domain-containing protein [Histomonas meleagridis]KAH0802541.1 coiled-coil domain-containing protein [Histomonas meleagridis]